MTSRSGNEHWYYPPQEEPAKAAAPTGVAAAPVAMPNAWLGRTKAQVEEDNMKIAKAEGAYDKKNYGKMVPSDMKDDQMCWVVELDDGHTLRYVFLFFLWGLCFVYSLTHSLTHSLT
jgi:hypothetical protein